MFWTNQNFRQDDGAARMQENARYALDAITADLQMSDFLFNVIDSSSLDTDLVNNALTTDCGQTATQWAIDLDELIEINIQATPSTINTNHTCINSSTLYTVGPALAQYTDVLAIKRVIPPATTLVDGKMYLQSTLAGDSRLVLHNHDDNPVPAMLTMSQDLMTY